MVVSNTYNNLEEKKQRISDVYGSSEALTRTQIKQAIYSLLSHLSNSRSHSITIKATLKKISSPLELADLKQTPR